MTISRREMVAGLAAAGFSSGWRLEAEPPAQKLLDYFAANARQLLRPAGGILKYPSISSSLPAKQYSSDLWDWDTYWTALVCFGLRVYRIDAGLHGEVVDHARGSLLNFLDHQSDEGRIPILISLNNPDFFESVKKDRAIHTNQAKLVMAQLALLVWGDDVAIGDDNDPTTFGRPFFSSANLLLNSLYYQDLMAAAELARRLKLGPDSDRIQATADTLRARIQEHCWDTRDRFFYSQDVQVVDRRTELIPTVPPGMATAWKSLPLRIQMFTGFLPMWCGVATKAQALDLVRLHYRNDATFRSASGVRSLSKQESMHSLDFSSNPSNWLGPTWIIVNYFVWRGLRDYGFKIEAAELAAKTVRRLSADLAANGSLNEYYHPDTGKPLSHQGFMDWNLLVLEMVDFHGPLEL